ncbi:MAG: UDP-glucose 4-epimerase GalE [Anaerolineae bacterium]|nr:UDP-glucose 4-epimerase GalE [Anaerolineae bacterium]
MEILITGGAGYIGSHACVAFLEAGYQVTVVDNLSNSSAASLEKVKEITGKSVSFYNTDLLDKAGLRQVFEKHNFEAVVHFAGLKAVGESVQIPLHYYHNNVTGSISLFEVMAEFGVKKIVFSSSATVYGEPDSVPITESFPLKQTNPYGTSKFMVERILQDLYQSDKQWNIALLRYFNPVGAHPSGKIGEQPQGVPNNLLPYITQVAVQKLEKLSVFGDDYDTPDGTGVRDYIHVMDLVQGHLKAIDKLNENPGIVVYNLGTGIGYSVLDLVNAFEKVSGIIIPYEIAPRRVGDIAVTYADPTKANRELGWEAKLGLEDMCADAWRWQSSNPNGYAE